MSSVKVLVGPVTAMGLALMLSTSSLFSLSTTWKLFTVSADGWFSQLAVKLVRSTLVKVIFCTGRQEGGVWTVTSSI